ncbi:carboxypeptidase regulatory-like domain-containing protein [Balneola sp. MJW-20]|uniref:carboxypeptidase regulatory-like domain-containing protein n=1 Tax=Gracilimonas aurantiaca TaxID=3234185 RepID=UPI003465EC29
MKRLLLLSLIALTGIFTACESTSSDDEISITGRVINNATGDPLDEAIVEIISPAEISGPVRVTDTNGNFTFSNIDVPESTDIQIEAKKTGFDRVTITVVASPGVDITLNDPIALIPDNAGGGGDGDGGDGVGGTPAGAASIILTNLSNESINIAQTGGIVNASFTFQVQDSAGRALDINNSTAVDFNIISGPGGGEGLTPTSARTNSSGKVTSNLFSGNRAGVVMVEAVIERPEVPLTIRSKPVLITITGGFPDADHFSIAPDVYNFEGYSINGNRNPVTVIVGDEFSNPVRPGTPVYFRTTGGIIQGSGQTDDDGEITVDLISGNPRPNDAILGAGFARVTASTKDQDGNDIENEIVILFSTSSANISINPTTINVPANGGQTFTYSVVDGNGNPMPAGTSIEVQAGEGLDATGDVSVTLGDYLQGGAGVTDFQFSVSDTDQDNSATAETSISIVVTTPAGNNTRATISGTRAKR